jgi:hypothetical protein
LKWNSHAEQVDCEVIDLEITIHADLIMAFCVSRRHLSYELIKR